MSDSDVERKTMRDQGMDYEQALHAIQSAIKFDLEQKFPHGLAGADLMAVIKHIRTGVDGSKAEQAGLAGLLIAKKVFTVKEYAEWMRLAANEEYARYEEHIREVYGLPKSVNFR